MGGVFAFHSGRRVFPRQVRPRRTKRIDRWIQLTAWLGVLSMVAACRPTPKPVTGSTAQANQTDDTSKPSGRAEPRTSQPAPSVAAIEQVCRSPLEPGCNPCCSEDVEGRWHRRDLVPAFCWFQEGAKTPAPDGLDPGYGSGHSSLSACPLDCRRCAKCSLRDEQELKLARSDRDCSKPQGCDTCKTRGSCGCYCSRRKAMEARCGAPE